MNIIQEDFKNYMEDQQAIFSSSGYFRVVDFNNLVKVINGTEEDFLVFDNAGGKKFDIMFDRTLPNEKGLDKLYKVEDFINNLLKEHKSWIYCYQINKIQTIVKPLFRK